MKPLEGLSVRFGALSCLAILLGMNFTASSSLSAATNAPGWKNVRILGGAGSPTLARVSTAGPSNSVYVTALFFDGKIENLTLNPGPWRSTMSIYDHDLNHLSTRLQPYASGQPNLSINLLTPLENGSMLYASMDLTRNSPLLLQRWMGQFASTITTPKIEGYAYGTGRGSLLYFTTAFSDGNGGLVLVGSFSELKIGDLVYQSLQSESPDVFLISLDSEGKIKWIKTAAGNQEENAVTGCRSPQSNSIFIGGHTTSSQLAFGTVVLQNPNGVDAPFIAKYTASGSLEWMISPKSDSIDRILALDNAADGGVFFLARTIPRTGGADLILGKCSSSGSIQWVNPAGRASLRTPLGDVMCKIATIKTDQAGDIILGYNFENSTFINGKTYVAQGGMDMLLSKFRADGTVAWVKTAGFIGDDYITDLTISPDSRIYATGFIGQNALFDETFVEGRFAYPLFLAELQNEFSELPEITAEPISQTIPTGKEASFQVTVAKPTESSYQWFFNGIAITGATNSTLLISSATAADQGSYYVEIKNIYGTVRSKAAQLHIDGQVEVLVTTYAGGHGPGYVDSTNPQLVQFYRPNGLAYLSQGLIAVADEFNQVIRLVGPEGAADTYAGNHEAGAVDAPAGLASFRTPIGLTVTPSQDILVADFGNDRIRRISAFGWRSVTTSAGSVRGYLDGSSDQALLNAPNDLVTDTAGNVYFTEFNNHTVRKLGTDGRVTTIAGNGFRGQADGLGTKAQFDHPGGIAIDRDGNLFVTEYSGLRIRKINRNGLVTTIAGSGARGFVDGKGTNALFNAPDGIALDPLGNIYVCEGGNHSIRKIDTQGNVLTIAGLGRAGFQNGNASTALFNTPGGLMWHPAGGLVVADTENHALRRVTFVVPSDPVEEAEILISLNPTLTLFGKVGATYRIEASEDPTVATDWVTLDSITLVNGVGMWCDSQPATRKWRYYRAVRTSAP